MQIGDNHNLFDWTYVDNVAHAHLLAADRLLLPEKEQYDANNLGFEHLSAKVGDGKDERFREPPTSVDRPSPPGVTDFAAATPTQETQVVEGGWGLDERPITRNKFDPLFHLQFPTEPCDLNPTPLVEGANLARDHLSVAGEVFFITNGQPIPFWDFPRALWKGVGRNVPPSAVWLLSKPVGNTLAVLSEWGSWLVGKTPLFTRFKVAFTASARYYNIEKARRVLAYEPIVSLEDGIDRSVKWWKETHPEDVVKA